MFIMRVTIYPSMCIYARNNSYFGKTHYREKRKLVTTALKAYSRLSISIRLLGFAAVSRTLIYLNPFFRVLRSIPIAIYL